METLPLPSPMPSTLQQAVSCALPPSAPPLQTPTDTILDFHSLCVAMDKIPSDTTPLPSPLLRIQPTPQSSTPSAPAENIHLSRYTTGIPPAAKAKTLCAASSTDSSSSSSSSSSSFAFSTSSTRQSPASSRGSAGTPRVSPRSHLSPHREGLPLESPGRGPEGPATSAAASQKPPKSKKSPLGSPLAPTRGRHTTRGPEGGGSPKVPGLSVEGPSALRKSSSSSDILSLTDACGAPPVTCLPFGWTQWGSSSPVVHRSSSVRHGGNGGGGGAMLRSGVRHSKSSADVASEGNGKGRGFSCEDAFERIAFSPVCQQGSPFHAGSTRTHTKSPGKTGGVSVSFKKPTGLRKSLTPLKNQNSVVASLGKVAQEKLEHESQTDRWLSSLVERCVTTGCVGRASVCLKKGGKGVNQDSALAWDDVAGTGITMAGIFDGHGEEGHLVSTRVRDSLPLLVLKHQSIILQRILEGRQDESMDIPMQALVSAHAAAFQEMDKLVKLHPLLNPLQSGCTAVTATVMGDLAVVANLGDSRCVLGMSTAEGTIDAVQLTEDHKPSSSAEKERIQSAGGRTFAIASELLVNPKAGDRLWLPKEDVPGLAMSRAIGDFIVKDYGLSATPEVHAFKVQPTYKFLILASDGIWDVLSNQEAVGIVDSSSSSKGAAKGLVDAATRRWRCKGNMLRDDISAVVLHL